MKSVNPTPEHSENADPPGDRRQTTELRLDFCNAPLHTILAYLHDTTDLPIDVNSNVEIDKAINLSFHKPVDKDGAVKLLGEAVTKEGYTAIYRRGRLGIVRSEDAKKRRIPLPMVGFTAQG